MTQQNNMPDHNDYLNYLSREKVFSDHILNHSRSMISIINRDYIYEKVNTTFCNAHKGVEEAIVGKSLGDVWGHETFNKHIKKNIDKCFSGDTVQYEASFTTPQAGKRYFEVVFRPFPVESGEITHLLAETFDITDLKLSEKIAIEKEEEFRKFETNLPIGFLRCRPDGKILHANKSFMMIMDCSEENSLYHTNLKNYYAEEGIFELHLDQLKDSKPKTFGRVLLKTCGGNEIMCRISGFMSLDEAGNPSYIDFAFEDSSRELMLENRLLQAQKLETIGALAGGIAHDFNNILTTISGYSELLQDDLPKSSPSSQKVARIMMAVSKARSLTNQILTFSRQMEQEKIPVNVYEVLKETIGFVKSAVPSNIKVKSNIRKKDAPVFADPTQLFRVFLNLMTNAIQAMEERKGTIAVSLAVVNGKKVQNELNKNIVADEYVLVTFSDTGKGMDPSLLRRIFEPFFTTREVGKGSGLGLSVVYGIVSEMGGDILVSSEKDKGSVFYIYLPVSREYVNISEIPEKRKKILFITGNKYESRILSLALESVGYELMQSSDYKHFSKVISDAGLKPDLIIYMSDAEQIGFDDLMKIFQNQEIKTPCILITDSNQELLEEKLINSGIIRQHLIKPVSLKEIKNAIQLSIN
ncbi:MAG: ATP-binding protein [Bacteroidia bacterium]|nr:ATP-binding protein [Bacteroidia bacterium]